MNQLEQLIRQAVTHQQQGKLPEAENLFRQVLQRDPANPLALHHLGLIAHMSKKPQIAMDLLIRSIQIAPKLPRFRTNFASVLVEMERLGEAEQQLRAAIEMTPKDLEVLDRLASLLEKQNRHAEAAAFYRSAVDLQSDSVELCAAAGAALSRLGDLDNAISCLRHAVALQNSNAEAHNNLGLAYAALGETEKAVTSLQRAVDFAPQNSTFHQNLLYWMHYHPDYEPAAIFADHRRWARTHADPLSGKVAHRNDRTPERPLRVGYIAVSFDSPRMRESILPIIKSHARSQVIPLCYSQRDDDCIAESTDPLWRPTRTFSDAELVKLFHYDRLDILIDLSLHEPGNRVLAFARKAVPIQITYAYPGTSGTSAIDYRFTDARLDPRDEKIYSEKSTSLPTYCCFDAVSYAESSPNTLAVSRSLCALGNLAAMNDHVLDTWSDILVATPESILLLPPMTASGSKRILDRLTRRDIAPQRIQFASLRDRLAQSVLALDVFPFADVTGAMTALAMNIPVITLAGATAVSRSTADVLELLNENQAITQTPGEYAKRAIAMISAEKTSNPREKILKSAICDIAPFARSLEKIYRDLWIKWCAGSNNSNP